MPGFELVDEEQVFEDLGVGAHGIGIEVEVGADPVEAGQATGARGSDIQESFNVLDVADVGDVSEVAADDGGDVAGEESRASPGAASLDLRVSAGDEGGRKRFAADWSSDQPRPVSVEEIVDEPLADVADLALGERPEGEIRNSSGQGISDGGQRQDVRRAGEQELATCLVGVEPSLDRQQKLRCALDLVDGDWSVDIGDEPGWVSSRGVGRRVIVKADETGWVLVGGDLGNERALTNLAGAQYRDRATLRSRRLRRLGEGDERTVDQPWADCS